MAANVVGKQFVFGIDSTDTPTGIAGFVCRSLTLTDEPEVYEEAQDGDGAVEAVAASAVAIRMKTGTFTGYIDKDEFDAQAAAASGSLVFRTLTYFVKSIGQPRTKGKFTEVSIEAEHLPLVQV